jgi:hypothetical protein
MAGKNFDELIPDDHTFTVRGVDFSWTEVRPEVLSAMGIALGKVEDDENDPDAGWAAIDEQVLLFIVPEDHQKWKDLRAREENPVTIKQLNAVLDYLIGEQSDRPTQTPSPSVSGRGKTAASSKAA